MSVTTDSILRVYGPDELGKDGYPVEWTRCSECAGRSGCADDWAEWHCERCDDTGSIKALVRHRADHRCICCRHPYLVGQHGSGEWSPCDELCRHGGPARFIRDSGEPSASGMPDSEALQMLVPLRPVEARWRILTVHHLDGDKANCRWFNLLALCQRDHLWMQGRVNPAQVYPFEHEDWFKPYAAGYYALTYLGEDLDRAETESRMDELLALERQV